MPILTDMTETRAKKLSLLLKGLTVLTSLGGLLISIFESEAHGYSHWSKRFLYFTAQSNVWIGGTMFAFLVCALFRIKPPAFLYALKYIFTVSITVTFLVFTCLLGPFGEASYHLWAFSSWLTHIFAPAFAVADFFVDREKIPLRGGQVWICLIPPLAYSAAVVLLELLNVDFGRGLIYPYFFMDIRSPVGLFGFSNELPYFAGTFYWFFALALIVWGIGALYLRLHERKENSTR